MERGLKAPIEPRRLVEQPLRREPGVQWSLGKFVDRIAVLHGPNSRLRAVFQADLPHDRLNVSFDRCVRDVARARDHPIAMPFYESIEDLGLTLRQPGHTLLIRCAGTVRRRLSVYGAYAN